MFTIPGFRKGYYQWDLNQKLYIQDSSCNEVHFCSEKHPEALTCLVQEESGKRYVQVPNILLQSCLPVTAFFYVQSGEEAYTKMTIDIEVLERPKPDDYVYTETEVKTWESAVEYALQEATNSGAFKGDRGEKGDKGDTGEQGPQGEKGDKGDGFLTLADKLELSIICDAEGEMIAVQDASDLSLFNLRIYGKTTQDGTPAPDAPVDLVSAGDNGSIAVTVAGGEQDQTVVALTPNGLPGIPVSSGGNYTDANGQQWLCDEIDFGRGVYVQRIGRVLFDANNGTIIRTLTSSKSGYNRFVLADNALKVSASSVVGAVLCSIASAISADNTYRCVDGIAVAATAQVILFLNDIAQMTAADALSWLKEKEAKVIYALATPIETPLSAEELVAYAALQTNKPNTTIYNDSRAWIQASYAADTKTYIDNKFAGLAAAIVNNT